MNVYPALILVCLLTGIAPALAQEDGNEEIAAEATDPLATLPQFSLQDVYTPVISNSEAQTNTLIGRVLVPRVPEMSLLPIAQLIRPSFFMVTKKSGDDGPTQTAFGDIALLDIFVSPWPRKETGFRMGLGPLFIFPTATEDFAGQNAWQAGPAFAFIYKKIPRLILGGLVQNTFSYAYTTSDHTDINALLVQPVIEFYLGRGFFVKSADATMKFEWKEGGAKLVPVSLGLGYLIRLPNWPPCTFFVSGEQMVYRANARVAPETSVRFGFTFAVPKWRMW